MKSPQYFPDVLTFLERFGVTVGYADPECEILDIQARDISAEELLATLRQYEAAVKLQLYLRRQYQMSVCVGGPCNGRHHNKWKGHVLTFHLGRARWAAYVVGDDQRAWFRGIATSRKKARKLAVTSTRGFQSKDEGGRGKAEG